MYRHLRIRLEEMNDNRDTIPISLVSDYLFCPRRAWLELQGEKVDSAQLQAGFSRHQRVDNAPNRGSGEASSVEIRSERLGVSGKTDVVRQEMGGLRVREYKATPIRKKAVVTELMRMQLALQRICLEEMRFKVVATEVYFTNHNQTVSVEIDDAAIKTAERAVEDVRMLCFAADAPEPLEDDAKCDYCSHINICLPDEKKLRPAMHKIRPSASDGQVVYLATPGTYAHLKKGRMIVEMHGEKLSEVPLETVHAVQVFGNISLSGGLIRELLWRDIPIQWCSMSGKLVGWSQSSCGPNGYARQRQGQLPDCVLLDFSREFISSKIANQATQLRRAGVPKEVVAVLRELQGRCGKCCSLDEVLGIEGKAASLYFSNWSLLIKEPLRSDWPFPKRSGRPASDPVNAMLNYAYALLEADAAKAIIACGLDPHQGFLHSSVRNKPALALDLMEEFRAPIADSIVQTLINCRTVGSDDFCCAFNSVRMNDSVRKAVISCYERRMTTEILHPVFKYKVTWRRALEIQARQILGVIEGSQVRYEGMRVR
jgi:CRISPR-associated protein Cas1